MLSKEMEELQKTLFHCSPGSNKVAEDLERIEKQYPGQLFEIITTKNKCEISPLFNTAHHGDHLKTILNALPEEKRYDALVAPGHYQTTSLEQACRRGTVNAALETLSKSDKERVQDFCRENSLPLGAFTQSEGKSEAREGTARGAR